MKCQFSFTQQSSNILSNDIISQLYHNQLIKYSLVLIKYSLVSLSIQMKNILPIICKHIQVGLQETAVNVTYMRLMRSIFYIHLEQATLVTVT